VIASVPRAAHSARRIVEPVEPQFGAVRGGDGSHRAIDLDRELAPDHRREQRRRVR
jgi:hypothetical protein